MQSINSYTLIPGESSVQNLHIPAPLPPPATAFLAPPDDGVFLCQEYHAFTIKTYWQFYIINTNYNLNCHLMHSNMVLNVSTQQLQPDCKTKSYECFKPFNYILNKQQQNRSSSCKLTSNIKMKRFCELTSTCMLRLDFFKRYLCLTVDPPPDRGLTDLEDGLRPAPTEVELAGAGCKRRSKHMKTVVYHSYFIHAKKSFYFFNLT